MLFALATLAVSASAPVTIYVNPSGNDRWSGRLAASNRLGTDGPVASLTVARDRARAIAAGTPVVVQVQGGVYRIEAPLELGAEDSGTASAPRVWRGSGRERTIVSGFRRLSGWRVADGRWTVRIPEGWDFAELFVNGERRLRPRVPKSGYLRIAEELAPSADAAGKGHNRFVAAKGDLNPAWRNLGDVEFLMFHEWNITRSRARSIGDDGTVELATHSFMMQRFAGLNKGYRYLVENVAEALDEPGEWYLDRSTRMLTYLPRPGETPTSTVVEAPFADSLVRMDGVRHLQMEGIGFEGTRWFLGAGGRNFAQAEADLEGAIRLANCQDTTIRGCGVRRVGGYALEAAESCHNVRFVGNHLVDLGAGGVKVGVFGNETDAAKVTRDNVVEGNLIVGGGRLHPAAVGVWLGQTPGNRVIGNTIHDFTYTGISAGWSWGYGSSAARDNLIADNWISKIGQRVLSDMGGIYTLSPQPGTVIRGNVIHDVASFGSGGWGIYPDEGSSNMLVENNLVYRTKSAGFHQHYGRENVIRNNVFAFGGEAQVMRTRAEDHLSFTFERNVVLFGEAPLLGSNWSGNNYRLDRNVYWRVGGGTFDFAGMALADWRAKGQDGASVIADPLFEDPENGDFRLKRGSPAFRVGFVPFPALDPTGRRKAALPKVPPTWPIPD